MSLNAARHNEIHPIYHVDPEEELVITFEDDNLRDCTLSMQEREPEGFCGGYEIL